MDLRSGGKVTIDLNFSVFDLSEPDRAFVNELVDMVKDYEEATKPRAKKEPAPSSRVPVDE